MQILREFEDNKKEIYASVYFVEKENVLLVIFHKPTYTNNVIGILNYTLTQIRAKTKVMVDWTLFDWSIDDIETYYTETFKPKAPELYNVYSQDDNHFLHNTFISLEAACKHISIQLPNFQSAKMSEVEMIRIEYERELANLKKKNTRQTEQIKHLEMALKHKTISVYLRFFGFMPLSVLGGALGGAYKQEIQDFLYPLFQFFF